MPRRATPFDDKRARIAALASSPPAAAMPELRRSVGLVEKAAVAQAVAALGALTLHRHDPRIVERVRSVVAARASARLSEALREHLGA